mmetsp:Transcript_24116/g.57015  ORF Transcript_24116/g.57015 Transcript_24116/m.57015 type:complete len:703 (+) Transcript_24116:178-2286(+)
MLRNYVKSYYDNSRFGSSPSGAASVGGEPPLSTHVGELPAFSRTEELRKHNNKHKKKSHKHTSSQSVSVGGGHGNHGGNSKHKSSKDNKHKHKHKSTSKDNEKGKTPGDSSSKRSGIKEEKKSSSSSSSSKKKSKKSSKRTEKYKKRLKDKKKLEGDEKNVGEKGGVPVEDEEKKVEGEEAVQVEGEEKKVEEGVEAELEEEEYVEEEIVEEEDDEDDDESEQNEQRDYFGTEEYPDSDDEYGDSDDDFDGDDEDGDGDDSSTSSSQYTTITVETAAINQSTTSNLKRKPSLVGGLLNRWGNRGGGAANNTTSTTPTTIAEGNDKKTIEKNTQVLVDGKQFNIAARQQELGTTSDSAASPADVLRQAVNDITKLSIKMKNLTVDEDVASSFLKLMRGDNRSWEAIAVDILRQKARWDSIEFEECNEATAVCLKTSNEKSGTDGENNNNDGNGAAVTATEQQNGGNAHNKTETMSYLDVVISHILSVDACGSLHLSSMVWTQQTAWSMQALTFSKSLHKLQLDLIDLNTFAVPMLIRGIRHNTSLITLTMSRCGLQDDKLGDLLANLPTQLEELRIFGNSCRLKGLASLTKALSQKDTKLRLLDLSYQHVTKDEAASNQFNLKEFCDVLAKNKSLQVLDFDNTSLNDEQLDYIITALTTNRSVEELTLNHNQISGTGVALLAAKMKQMKGLKKVSMYNNGFES